MTEVSDAGSVPYLQAVNMGPWPVLIFDGEELVGAKQNRIVNTTILVGVGKAVLPVSCENGRWSRRRGFLPPGPTPATRLSAEKKGEASAREHDQARPEAGSRGGLERSGRRAAVSARSISAPTRARSGTKRRDFSHPGRSFPHHGHGRHLRGEQG